MRGGCAVPILLFLLLVSLFRGGGFERAETERVIVDDRGDDRRPPLIAPNGDQYLIEDPARAQDGQGTAFAINRNGDWLTAQHVVAGCDRVAITNGRAAVLVDRVSESATSDSALIEGGLPSPVALALAKQPPLPGARGYHVGFPRGEPALVVSELIGAGDVIRSRGGRQAVLAWAEQARVPNFDHMLSGISGGPTFDASGLVVGINSAGSERRGRVLTTHPAAFGALATNAASDLPTLLPNATAATIRFQQLLDAGAVRIAICDVD